MQVILIATNSPMFPVEVLMQVLISRLLMETHLLQHCGLDSRDPHDCEWKA